MTGVPTTTSFSSVIGVGNEPPRQADFQGLDDGRLTMVAMATMGLFTLVKLFHECPGTSEEAKTDRWRRCQLLAWHGEEGARWNWNGVEQNLFEGIAQQGVTDLRIRLWTRDDGPNGKEYATQVVRQALKAGLDPYLVIFLSDDWADLMKQPVPAAWKDLSFDERVAAVRSYSRDIVTHFRKEGLTNHLYEIGNEIDYGICGEYPGKSSKKDPASLKRRLWPRTAQLILASQAGVLESDPDAKFLLHISHWWDVEFVKSSFSS